MAADKPSGFDYQAAAARVYYETQWGCRGMATFYPPISWLKPFVHETCPALGGRCEWPGTCGDNGSCAYGAPTKES